MCLASRESCHNRIRPTTNPFVTYGDSNRFTTDSQPTQTDMAVSTRQEGHTDYLTDEIERSRFIPPTGVYEETKQAFDGHIM